LEERAGHRYWRAEILGATPKFLFPESQTVWPRPEHDEEPGGTTLLVGGSSLELK